MPMATDKLHSAIYNNIKKCKKKIGIFCLKPEKLFTGLNFIENY
jgi:glutamine synthetase type III